MSTNGLLSKNFLGNDLPLFNAFCMSFASASFLSASRSFDSIWSFCNYSEKNKYSLRVE